MITLDQLNQFNQCPTVMALRQDIASQSILEIVGVERRETRHSKFIKWLLTDGELNVASPTSPLFHLLDAIIKRDLQQHKLLKNDFSFLIACRDCVLKDVSVEVEHHTKGFKLNGKEGLIDILIRGEIVDGSTKKGQKFMIAIENKVCSQEHDEQTQKYEAYLTGRGVEGGEFADSYICPRRKDEEVILVYLTPSSEYEMSKPLATSSKNYIHINYQDLVDYVLDPIMTDTEVSNDKKYKIQHYLISLSVASDVDFSGTGKMPGAMAISEELKDLVMDFWDKHKDLIKEAVCIKGGYEERFYNANKWLIDSALNALLVFMDPNEADYPDIRDCVCAINS